MKELLYLQKKWESWNHMKNRLCTFTVEMEKERRRRQRGLQFAQLEVVCGFCLPVF